MTKKLLFAAALSFASQFTIAQTQKGSQNLGLYLGFTNTSSANVSFNNSYGLPFGQQSKTTNFNIGPSCGYFVKDGLELSGTLSFSHNNQSSINDSYVIIGNGDYRPVTSTTKLKSNVYGLTAYLRKYILFQNKIGFRAGPYVGYQRGKSAITYGGVPGNSYSTTTTNTYNVGGTFDGVYYPSTNFGLAATIGSISYTNSKGKGANPNKTESFNFNFINSGLLLSVFYTFGK